MALSCALHHEGPLAASLQELNSVRGRKRVGTDWARIKTRR